MYYFMLPLVIYIMGYCFHLGLTVVLLYSVLVLHV